MPPPVLLAIDGQNAYLSGARLEIVQEISHATSYLLKGREHSAAFQNGYWDGRKKLASMMRDGRLRLPVGLAQDAADVMDAHSVKYEVVNARQEPEAYLTFPFDYSVLRPYQHEAMQLVTTPRGSLGFCGCGIVKMPPRSGKTLTAAAIIAELGVRALFIVPAKTLLHQARRELSRRLGVEVGIVGDEEFELQDVTVATIQTLYSLRGGKRKTKTGETREAPRSPRYDEVMHGRQLVIMDECFPAGTLVGDKPIEAVRAGERVPAFDERNQQIVKKKVVRVFERRCNRLVALHFAGGRTLVCTPNHPIYTPSGWRQAGSLQAGSEVLSTHGSDAMHGMRQAGEQDPKAGDGVLRRLPVQADPSTAKNGSGDLSLVQGADRGEGALGAAAGSARPGVLFGPMQAGLEGEAVFRNDGGHESAAGIREDEAEQPDARGSKPQKGGAHSSADRAPTALVGWQGASDDRPTAAAAGHSENQAARMDARVSDRGEGQSQQIADLHLPGPGVASGPSGGGGRRGQPLHEEGASGRSAKRGLFAWVRVDRVEVHEPGSDGTFERLCPHGMVYNLEVEQLHTYVANGFVVHNCHHLEADEWRKVLQDSQAPYKVGLSATVFLDHVQECELGVIWLRACTGDVLIDISVSDLIEQGYLVRPDVRLYPIRKPEMNPRRRWSKTLQQQAILRNDTRNGKIVDVTAELARDGMRTVIISNRHEQVDELCGMLRMAGLRFERVVGETPQKERDRAVERLCRRDVEAVIGTVFGEGVDIPEVDACVNAEGGSDIKKTYQRLRCLTPHNGKSRAVFVDFVDLMHPYFAAHSRRRLSVYRDERAFRVSVEK